MVFSKGEEFSNPQNVCLPHTVELTPENSSGCRNYQGICHYKKEILIPNEYSGQKLILELEGAMGAAKLYINGKAVAEHFCGYTPFVADIGKFVKYGENNELYITLDNSDDPTIPPGKPQKDLDFSYDGGLYRDVKLTVFNPLYITNPILTEEVAGGGIYVWYENVTEGGAEVFVQVQIKNEYAELKDYILKLTISDNEENIVGECNLKGSLEKDCTEYLKGRLEVLKPRLWSPETPFLYNLNAKIICDNDEVYEQSLKIGIRGFKYSEMNFDLQKAFADIVHEEYPFGDCYTASDYGPTDVAYCEYDPGMLGSDQEKFGLVEQKDTTPRPMWVREYGDAPDNFFDQNAVWRAPRAWGDFPMVEAVNRMLHRFDTWREGNHQYIDVSNNKRLCGYGIWPVISHNRGYHINPCWGGHLDLFRIPKFSYYFMQSQQDREKAGDVIFIANWWSEMSPPDVTVYSNAQSVRLYCDGKLVAEQKPDDVSVKHPPFTFKDVKRNFKGRDRSCLKAEAVVDGEVVATHSVFAPGIARALKLEADFEGIPFIADGADIIAVRCSMVDDKGNVVPFSCDNHPIVFSLEGEGIIVGDETIGANPKCPEAGIATVLVKSTKKSGEIKLTAKMLWQQNTPRAIKSAELIIKSEFK